MLIVSNGFRLRSFGTAFQVPLWKLTPRFSWKSVSISCIMPPFLLMYDSSCSTTILYEYDTDLVTLTWSTASNQY